MSCRHRESSTQGSFLMFRPLYVLLAPLHDMQLIWFLNHLCKTDAVKLCRIGKRYISSETLHLVREEYANPSFKLQSVFLANFSDEKETGVMQGERDRLHTIRSTRLHRFLLKYHFHFFLLCGCLLVSLCTLLTWGAERLKVKRIQVTRGSFWLSVSFSNKTCRTLLPVLSAWMAMSPEGHGKAAVNSDKEWRR